ncbi:MAG: response regulator [Desulfobacterales bacterium]|nr:response regulator [Desulfobacterales bacterium]
MNLDESKKAEGTILVVDDNPFNLDILQKLLTDNGYEVRSTTSGKLALKYIQKYLPDLLLLDVKMPDMDGFEVLNNLKANPETSEIPAIFISAVHDTEEKLKGFSSGAVDYITKPFQEKEILCRVQTHISLRKINKNLEKLVKERTNSLVKKTHELEISEDRLKALIKLHSMKDLPEKELCKYALEEAVRLTESKAGFFHFISDYEKTISLFLWSKDTLKICKSETNSHYPLEKAGIWADSLRMRKIVIHNDYPGYDAKKGYPEGHFPVLRHMSVPIFDNNHVVAIVGVGNKEMPYDESDSRQLFLFFNSTWDIIKQRRTDEEKRLIEKQLRHAQKMEAIGTLAGGIAHDFNNILSIIMGYSELILNKSSLSLENTNDVDKILAAANRAKDLIKQILTFSRKEDNKFILLNPAFIIKETMKMLNASIPKNIEIKQKIDFKSGMIMGEPVQIQQVLMNLCTNAYHAMEKTGGILSVELKNADNYVELTVCDTGYGIEPEITEKIFDPYFTTKDKEKGTGLGLSIVQGIVEKCGGKITVESFIGKGTKFTILFPIVNDKEIIKEKSHEKALGGNERILFVEDEEAIANMYKIMLEEIGYTVTIKTDANEALEQFQKDPTIFDLLITDQTMPKMTGDEFAKKSLKIRPDIPIILYTGYSSVISQDEAKKIGIKKFVLKPIGQNDFTNIIRRVLNESKIR